ncbi:hypothetical protein EC991_000953 [Linnemannia zychae]|nr:hypothetical protein EC991_000953 [Linnemannia zychae]
MQQAIRGYFSSSQKQPALFHRVLLIGAPGSGKTTLLNRLRLAESSTSTTNTVTEFGVTTEMVTIDDRHLSIRDLGLTRQAIILRNHIGYEDLTIGIVCVVDSTNVLQLEETKAWLLELYEEYGAILGDSVLLVFANKQDRSDAMSVAEVKELMELDTRALSRRWHIEGLFATTGEGVFEGMSWLAYQLEEPLPLLPTYPMFSSIGSLVSSFKATLTPSLYDEEDSQKVTMLGLSGAGKTSILNRLAHNKIVLPTYTDGFNKETIQLSPSHKRLTIWDQSGASGNVRFWNQLLDEDRVPVIFVIDSTKPRGLDEVKRALSLTYRFNLKESTRFGVLLVICNKQDLHNAMLVEEIRDRLGLNEIWQWGRRWHICGVSAMTGEGLWEGIEWLETQLTRAALPSPFLRTK